MDRKHISHKKMQLHPPRFGVWILLGLIFVLTGCHFPQTLPQELPRSKQHQTDIAGILNPAQLETPPVTATPSVDLPIPAPEITPIHSMEGEHIYVTQQGDTLPALAKRFDVSMAEIRAEVDLDSTKLLPIGLPLQIQHSLDAILPYHSPIFPDSEVIYGPTVQGFDVEVYAESAGGFLTSYREELRGEMLSGPEIVRLVALESSINPRLLMAFLEYRSGWVLGQPPGAVKDPFPIGFGANDSGLYNELMITAKLLAQGFYGWRDGSQTDLTFFGGSRARLSPGLNAGSTAIMHLFATLHDQEAWEDKLFGADSFLLFYQGLFGDPWSRAVEVEPYMLSTIEQPVLTLPFSIGERWSLTGGPHITWQTGTPWGALDFAPITGEPHCMVSKSWVTASAPGLIVRSERNVVAIDLDGDGDEGTGWVLIYMHIADDQRIAVGTWVGQDEPIGHPSCEGGTSSGTHVHFARKFNGEWMGVGDPLPLFLSGWRVYAGESRYVGYLQKGEQIVTSRPDGSSGSTIIRDE
jgi:LysM repeat protein